MPFEFNIPKEKKSIIKVIGVGGGGSNAVSHMFRQGIIGVDFAVCNTDHQSVDSSPVQNKIQLGPLLTDGNGAGSKPQVGKEACIESIDSIREFLGADTKMLFVTAGMGGGTGTGAAPIIAHAAREMGILTVGIVTLPFGFEGTTRNRHAHIGIEELKENVDALIVVSNDKLRDIYGDLKISEAFSKADDILTTAAKGIAEIITIRGYVNVDFEDVNTVMRTSGVAIMGRASASGENRAIEAISKALNSPLLEDNDIRGAKNILLNISSGDAEISLEEVGIINEYVQTEAGNDTNIIWGNTIDENLESEIAVTVIATGFTPKQDLVSPSVRDAAVPKIKVSLESETETEVELTSLDEEMFEIETSAGVGVKTIEFDDLDTPTIKKPYDDPFVRKAEQKPTPQINHQEQQETRVNLDFDKINSNRVETLDRDKIREMEDVPAYERQGITLDDVDPAGMNKLSRYTITDDNGPAINTQNTFLNDNVD